VERRVWSTTFGQLLDELGYFEEATRPWGLSDPVLSDVPPWLATFTHIRAQTVMVWRLPRHSAYAENGSSGFQTRRIGCSL